MKSKTPITKPIIEWKQLKQLEVLVPLFVLLNTLPVFFGLQNENAFFSWRTVQFNTALAFTGIGLSSFFLYSKKYLLSRFFASCSFLIGALTFFQHVSGLDLGIDHFFFASKNLVYSDHPGRMAWNTSITLVVVSVALFLLAHVKTSGRSLSIAGICAGLTTAFGLITLLGNDLSFGTSIDVASITKMPLSVAFCFVVIGTHAFLVTYQRLKSQPAENYRVIPLLLNSLLSFLVLIVWQYSIKQEEMRIHETFTVQVSTSHNLFNAKLEQLSRAMSRYAARLALLGITNKKFLALDSKNYIQQFDMIKSVGIVDQKFTVKWSYPDEVSYQVKDFVQKSASISREAFEKAKLTHRPVFSKVFDLGTGGLGSILPVALYQGSNFTGAVYATIELEKLFANYINNDYFGIIVREGERVIFQKNASTAQFSSTTIQQGFQTNLAPWTISISPSRHYINSLTSSAPAFILFLGELLVYLFVFIFQSHLKSQAEKQKLLENEKLFLYRMNLAMESAQIGAMSLDLNTGEVWRSYNHDFIFGYQKPLPVWTLEQVFSYVHPDDLLRVQKNHNEALITTSSHRVEFRVVRPEDKEVRWLKMVAQTIRGIAGQPLRLECVIQDITEEKIRSLEHSRDLNWRKAILNGTEYSIIATDTQGVIQTYNKAAETMLGYSADDMIGKQTPALFHDLKEIQGRALTLTQELGLFIEPGFDVFVIKSKLTRQPDVNEWTYVRKDGSRLPVQLSVTTLFDQDGLAFGYLGIATDLTARKAAENALRSAHDRLERVIEATGEGIWERSMVTQKIDYIDPQCKRIYGFQVDDHPTLAEISELVHPDDQIAATKALEDHIKNRTERFSIEYRIRDRIVPGAEKWLRARGQVSIKNGHPEQLISTISDVTEIVLARKKLEQALISAEAAAVAKSTFLASMSHEIRTPLNGIIGMTDLLLETDLTPQQKNFTQIVQQSGSVLLSLINDVLDFSKIEAGKMEMENTSISVARTVEDQIDVLISKARAKKLTLVSFISTELPAQIQGDSGRLGQVLLNLISNAVKFTEHGGVSISVFKKTSHTQPQERIRFEITDTGIGLRETSLQKLFQPFNQGDASISNRYGGTGLGLSICKKLVEAMNGSIGVNSVYTAGSTFWFEIPLIYVKDHLDHATRVGWEHLVGIKTLLIDSDPISQKSIHNYIISSKMKNGSVTTTDEALKMLTAAIQLQDPYKLVLIAPDKSKRNGHETLNSLKNVLKEQMPKAIYLCEFGSLENEADLLKLGFSAVVDHPIKQSQFLNSLVSVLINAASAAVEIPKALSQKTQTMNLGMNVLIADDVSVNQILTETMLEFLGYNSISVANGLEVLEILKTRDFDLILMDCQMPELDGFEATKQIRASKNTKIKNIPIVALTANAMAGDAAKCLEAGMNDYLSKPFKREQLGKILEKWLPPAGVKQAG